LQNNEKSFIIFLPDTVNYHLGLRQTYLQLDWGHLPIGFLKWKEKGEVLGQDKSKD